MFTSFRAIRIGTAVKVYMGADWQRGNVHSTTASSCCVQLLKRIVTVYDLRNIKLP